MGIYEDLISPDHGSKLRLPHLSACRQVTPAAVAPVAVEAEAVERLGLPWSGGGSVAEKRHPLWGGSPTLSAMSAMSCDCVKLRSDPEVTVAGWQTESEDESMEHLNRIGSSFAQLWVLAVLAERFGFWRIRHGAFDRLLILYVHKRYPLVI